MYYLAQWVENLRVAELPGSGAGSLTVLQSRCQQGLQLPEAWLFWVSKMAHSPDFDHMTSRPHDFLIIWKRAVPRASHPRQQGRSGSVFYNGASKGTLSLLRVLLVTKTNPATMWETTMQGDGWGPGCEALSDSKWLGCNWPQGVQRPGCWVLLPLCYFY